MSKSYSTTHPPTESANSTLGETRRSWRLTVRPARADGWYLGTASSPGIAGTAPFALVSRGRTRTDAIAELRSQVDAFDALLSEGTER